ncbi:MAG: hypothetical protein HY658_03540 [Actinobacteria bacterium]|nr:hypothetical protein [Actinomycetota bacterium]
MKAIPMRAWVAVVAAAVLLLGACSTEPRRPGDATTRPPTQTTTEPSPTESPTDPRVHPGALSPEPPPPVGSGGELLVSGLEQPVCGSYNRPPEGCEFGVQGDVETGPWGCRTGAACVRIQRMSPEHMGVIAEVPIPGGHAFVGVAHRIPELPEGAFDPAVGYIELEQLSPTDGTIPGYPVEVRLYEDRRIGLALLRDRQAALSEWRVPVDDWFYVVVELSNGSPAPVYMWIYDDRDRLVDQVAVSLDTARPWGHADRFAHKLGGNTSTLAPVYTYVDDWYVATEFLGPLHVEPSPTADATAEPSPTGTG